MGRTSSARRLLTSALAVVILGAALAYGRTRAAPDIATPIRAMFPSAAALTAVRGVIHVRDTQQRLIGWAATGSAQGYGGPLLVVTGIDSLGLVVGVHIIEQRETPVFWRMVRAPEVLGSLTGRRFDATPATINDVHSVSGATLSLGAIVAANRAAVSAVAGAAFDVRLPPPPRPFEFGLLEIVVLALLATGLAAQGLGGPARRRLRWASQIAGLVVLGFWENSPITLAKLAALSSGFFPDPRIALALYALVAGFVVTSLLFGRNLYCLYACPFGAAQRVVGLIGGTPVALPPGLVRLIHGVRDVIVFAALFVAFLSLMPTVASYEPFAALFALRGTTLQWVLLFLVLVASLAVRTPWCHLLCPMRTVELRLQDVRHWVLRRRGPAGA
jgi:NosR/NirI family nitrous oxide reductase transcriptional regulator